MEPGYRIEGRVTDTDGTGLAQARVEAWDKDLFFDDFVGSADTDAAGKFSIEFNQRHFRELIQKRPDLYLKVRYQGTDVPAARLRVTLTLPDGTQRTGSSVMVAWQLAPGTTVVAIEVGETPFTADFTVLGHVLNVTRRPAVGLRVRAFDKDLRAEQLLGEAATSATGAYEIPYTAEQFRRAEKFSADLVVRAYDASGAVAAESALVFNAKSVETIDLVLAGDGGGALSEYEVLLAAITPVLEELVPGALTDEDIAFLVGDTGVDRDQLIKLRGAAQLAAAAANALLSSEVFYAFARAGLPCSSLADVLSRPLPRLQQTLEQAIEKRVVPLMLRDHLPAILAALQACMTQHASEPQAEGSASFAALLDACPTLVAAKRDRLLEMLASFCGGPQTFFAELSQLPGFAGDVQLVSDVRVTLQFAALSRNHLPMVVALNRLRAGSLPGQPALPTGEARDLARLTVDDWLQLTQTVIDGSPVGFPPNTPGADDAEKASNYAAQLFRRVEETFPTAAVSHQLARADAALWPCRAEVAAFLQSNPNFDLRTTRLDAYWSNQLPPAAPAGGGSGATSQRRFDETEPATPLNELRTLQRLFRVAPRFSQIDALRSAGFTAARSVARMTRNSFTALYGAALGGVESASAIYEASAQRVAEATQVWGSHSWDFDRALPAYVPRMPTPPAGFIEKEIPNWTTLFGSPSYCACQHCRSIYSPAAYFVEVLQFLRNETSVDAQEYTGVTPRPANGLDVLLLRRPDLAHIELSCANTNTPLPYIDLVNEVLERAIANAQPTPSLPDRVWPQTTWTAAELAANPEHQEAIVYDSVLASQYTVFPWDLPFDLNAEEARTYLAHLGTSRAQLMETFFAPLQEPSGAVLDEAIAREHLGMTQTEWHAICGALYGSEADWHALWGLNEECRANGEALNPDVPSDRLSWDQALRNVALLLQRSRLSLDELRELLTLRFVNPYQEAYLEGLASCNVEEVTLRLVDEVGDPQPSTRARQFLRRLCIFVRLQRRLEWSAVDLDQALTAVRAPPIVESTLLKLSHVKRLQARLRITLPQLLCWWGDLPTTRQLPEVPSLFEALFLNNTVLPKDLPQSDAGVFEALLSDPAPAVTSETITAHMPRVAAGLNASVEDIALLLDWTPVQLDSSPTWNLLTVPNLSRLHRILSMCRALRLTVKEFTALAELRGRTLNPLPAQDLNPNETQTSPTENLLHLLDALDALRASPFRVADVDCLLRHRFHSPESAEADLRSTALIIDSLRAGLQNIDAAAPADEAPDVTQAARLAFMKQHLAQALKVEPAIAEQLVETWVRAPSGQPCAEVLLDPTFRTAQPLLREGFVDQKFVLQSDCPQQFKAMTRLRKAATLIVSLRITTKAARFLFGGAGTIGVFDLNALPDEQKDEIDAYASFFRVIAVCRLRDAIGTTAPDLFDLFDDTANPDPNVRWTPSRIAQRLGWKVEDLEDLIAHFDLNRLRFVHEATLLRLSDCFKLSRRLGVTFGEFDSQPPRLLAWAARTVTAQVARSIKQAAKAKYDDAQWLKLAKPLQDPLRERRRQALVSYLTGRWNWTTDRLYACYLIDAEMQPCMLTSRIKQAISSAQLFVQRCMLGLEAGVEIRSDAARWWGSWMKNYRVWEANRKIFAHPENWIEPELRDDRSPFFKELENELRKGDITQDSVEQALLNYLEKLDRVSHLEITAQYADSESGRFYVFGRTPDTPSVHFFRYRDGYGIWSPWEKIDLDIEGDQLIPVVWNRRLHLFWPLFKEVTQKQKAPASDEPVGEAQKLWEIRFAYAERWTDKWSPNKVTRKPLLPTRTDWLVVLRVPVLEGEDLLARSFWGPWGDGTNVNNIEPKPHFGEAKNTALFHIRPSLDGTTLRLQTYYVYKFFEDDSRLSHRQFHRGRYRPTGDCSLTSASARCLPASGDDIFLPLNAFGFVHGGTLRCSNRHVFFETPSPPSLEAYAEEGVRPAYESSIIFWSLAQKEEFSLLFSASVPAWFSPLVFQDAARTLLVVPKWLGVPLYSAADLMHALVANYPQSMGQLQQLLDDPANTLRYQIEKLYHPYVDLFINELRRVGVDGLLKPLPETPLFRQSVSASLFGPHPAPYRSLSPRCDEPCPGEAIEFDIDSSDSNLIYNWELFFHIPLLIADRLSTNQRFEDAQRWYHNVFDPTEVIPKRSPEIGAWRLKPFYENQQPEQSLADLMKALNGENLALANAVRQWRDNPFKPHLIARLREGAPYMKTVVMKYIDNLIAWGDSLFRRDTIESLNEATQLYVLAAELLGPRPPQLPELERDEHTYASLKDRLDDFGNATVALENTMVAAGPNELEAARYRLLPDTFSIEMAVRPQLWAMAQAQAAITRAACVGLLSAGGSTQAPAGTGMAETAVVEESEATALPSQDEFALGGAASAGRALPLETTLYFCVPVNDKLLRYWDTVGDRLFKIRHCMNIEGVVRQLPLFEPPIEPGLLVRAAAAGLDLSTVLSEIDPPRGPYRFNVVLQKALEFCGDVKALGAALLAALEKRDAEALSLLRSTHELRLLDAVDDIKRRQIEEAQANLKALERTRELTELRLEHYTNLEFMNPSERQQLDLMTKATMTQVVAQALQLAASGARNIPNFMTGYVSLGGAATASFGGENIAGALEASASYFNNLSSLMNAGATQSGILGGHQRRAEDWGLQKRLAAKELQQIDRQIVAAEIRLALAEKEQENHTLQREQAAEVDEVMRSKFTNQDLYDWMVSQLSSLYFQSYQLASTVAKRAEVAYRFERGLRVEESNFIQFGYWENLKSGLLAGEKLHYDLRRLDNAYLEQNTRDLELTKHISLALLDPEQLIALRQTGSCSFRVNEELLDLDFPGHYMRRIKSVSLSIPCVVGPYTGVNATLRLVRNTTRVSRDAPEGTPYSRSSNPADSSDFYYDDENRFRNDWIGEESVAMSHAQNDSGVFELNFRDERYLPFEGAGVVSTWSLELSGKWTNEDQGGIVDLSQFDFSTVTDVILHLSYTARYGGEALKKAARDSLIKYTTPR